MATDSNTQGGAYGGRAPGIDQAKTPLDSDQHGQAQNTIDETKQNFGGQNVERDIGANMGASGANLTDRVDDLLAGNGSGDIQSGAQKKAQQIDDQGLKVGAEEDAHDLAASKQP